MFILILAGVAILFYVSHSVLAASVVKQQLAAIISPRYYRLFYNAVAIGFSALLLWLFLQTKSTPLFHPPVSIKVLGWILLLGGGLLGLIALRQYDLREFVGISYYKPSSSLLKGALQIKGINNWVRHPLYLATLMVVWAWFLLQPRLAVLLLAGITTVYTFIGIYFEEKKLLVEFGEEYREYQKKIPMLFPFFSRKKWSNDLESSDH